MNKCKDITVIDQGSLTTGIGPFIEKDRDMVCRIAGIEIGINRRNPPTIEGSMVKEGLLKTVVLDRNTPHQRTMYVLACPAKGAVERLTFIKHTNNVTVIKGNPQILKINNATFVTTKPGDAVEFPSNMPEAPRWRLEHHDDGTIGCTPLRAEQVTEVTTGAADGAMAAQPA